METRHAVVSQAKVDAIAAAIEANGWQGAPLVTDGETLITGVHRYAAWRSLDRPDYELPTIDIRDVFAAAGLDYDAIYTDEAEDLEWDVAIEFVLRSLPTAILDQYGIEI